MGSTLLILAVAGVGAFWAISREAPAESASAPPVTTGSDVVHSSIPLEATEPIPMTVYLSPTCGCCKGWVDHVSELGFDVTLEYRENMAPVKEELGIRPEHSSCHTAVVNGYVIEGHVPGDVLRRFLAEAPAVLGLAAPGMPIGSPGMEAGDAIEPYDVVTFTSSGRTEVYSREGRN
jgi:hypothetical protein